MLNFICEWIDRSVTEPDEYESTFAQFYIQVNDRYLTKVLHAGADERNYIRIPVYSVAEWIVYNWWTLLYEVESPFRDYNSFIFRHSLLSGADGYAIPNIIFYPQTPNIQICCNENRKSLSNIVFVNIDENFLVGQDVLAASFEQLITSTLIRLNEKGFKSTPLHQRWSAIKNLSVEEQEYCKVCGMLGLDPFDVESSISKRVIDVYEEIPSSVIVDFFSTASIETILDNARIAKKFYRAAIPSVNIPTLDEFKNKLIKRRAKNRNPLKPWNIGYRCARLLRKHFEFKDDKIATPDMIMDKIGVSKGIYNNVCKVVDYEQRKTIFSSYRTEDEKLCFSIAKGTSQQQAFYLARAVYSHLSSDDAYRIVTPSYTMDQQENRAFAAELIAPSSLLKKELRNAKFITHDDIERISQEFNVYPKIIEHQIQNHFSIEIR